MAIDRIRLYGCASTIDLSMVDVNLLSKSARETANCYVVKKRGKYMFPLVYGCGIKNNSVNSSSYVKQSGTYTNNFFNYLSAQVTSPYTETDTSTQAASAEVIQYDTVGFSISNISIENGSPCRFLHFTVDSIPSLGGNAIIAIKDGSGSIMWSWHIWAYPFTLSTFTHTNTNGYNYNLLNVNIGWVKESVSSNVGFSPYYQWGRKDPLLRSGATSGSMIYSSYATNPSLAIKSPTTFYNRDNFENWWSPYYNTANYYTNYWDANKTTTGASDKTVVKTIYDPCPPGFSVPCGNAFLGVTAYNGGTFNSGYTWDGNYFHCNGNRNSYTSITAFGTNGYYWLSSSKVSGNYFQANRLTFQKPGYTYSVATSDNSDYGSYMTAYGYSIRPTTC